jgi:hypothetical protein
MRYLLADCLSSWRPDSFFLLVPLTFNHLSDGISIIRALRANPRLVGSGDRHLAPIGCRSAGAARIGR